MQVVYQRTVKVGAWLGMLAMRCKCSYSFERFSLWSCGMQVPNLLKQSTQLSNRHSGVAFRGVCYTSERKTANEEKDSQKASIPSGAKEELGIEELVLENESNTDIQASSKNLGSFNEPDVPEKLHAIEPPLSKFEKIMSIARKSRAFEVEEFCDILHELNAYDICVIEIPKEHVYADYLVIATCRSTRVLNVCCTQMVKVFKHKQALALKGDSEDAEISGDVTENPAGEAVRRRHVVTPKIEGERVCRDWLAVDFGNIVLHAFLANKRAKMDLESLWLFGERYDEALQRADSNTWTTVDWLKILNDAAATRQSPANDSTVKK